jgi:ATP-dependent exoDNAse (exonuclease V) alpha subunit
MLPRQAVAEEPSVAAGTVFDLVARRVPRRYGFQRGEVELLSPMDRGEWGVGALNTLLQERLNPRREVMPEAHRARRAAGRDAAVRVGGE